MSVKGKKKYAVYLTEKEVKRLKWYFDSRPYKGGLSGFFDDYIKSYLLNCEYSKC